MQHPPSHSWKKGEIEAPARRLWTKWSNVHSVQRVTSTIESPRSILSPRDLARALGVSESSVKRWVDDGQLAAVRTSGGHRRIPIAEAVRFIRKTGTPVVHPEVLSGASLLAPGATSSPGAEHEITDRLHEALASDEPGRGRAMLLSLYLSGWPLAAIFDGPVKQALARIGERWRHEALGVVVEHRATDTCLGALAELRTLIAPPGPDAPLALGGAPSGDPYLLPSLMIAITLADQGFAERNLGPDTPLEVMVEALPRYQPRLVWLTSSVIDRPVRDLSRHLVALSEGVRPWEGVVVFGGRTVKALPRLPDNVHHLGSMTELAAFAKGLRATV